MRHFFKKCEEFTLCGGVGAADGLFTHGYPDNYAMVFVMITFLGFKEAQKLGGGDLRKTCRF